MRNYTKGIDRCTLGAISVQAYYARLQALDSIQTNAVANRNNDLAALNANLITKKEYYVRQPKDRPSNHNHRE